MDTMAELLPLTATRDRKEMSTLGPLALKAGVSLAFWHPTSDVTPSPPVKHASLACSLSAEKEPLSTHGQRYTEGPCAGIVLSSCGPAPTEPLPSFGATPQVGASG